MCVLTRLSALSIMELRVLETRRLLSRVSASPTIRTSSVTAIGRKGAKMLTSKERVYVENNDNRECALEIGTGWKRRTSTHSLSAIAAVNRTTTSVPCPLSFRR